MQEQQKKNRIADLLGEQPQTTEAENASPPLDQDDFDTKVEEVPQEPESDSTEERPGRNPVNSENDSGSLEEEEPEEVETEEVDDENLTEEERKQKEASARIKKEVVQSLMEPETLIALADMILSRAGTIANKSKKEDWKLDEDEKEIFAKLLTATVEEEGVEFWPAKYWIGIALLFVYGMKGFDVWDEYYSEEAKAEQAKLLLEESGEAQTETHQKQTELRNTEMERLQEEADIERKIKELKLEIQGYQQNGDPQVQKEEPKIEEPEVTAEDPNNTDRKDDPPVKIDPEDRHKYRYDYDDKGVLQFKNDGSPRLRKGRKPGDKMPERDTLGKFVSK